MISFILWPNKVNSCRTNCASETTATQNTLKCILVSVYVTHVRYKRDTCGLNLRQATFNIFKVQKIGILANIKRLKFPPTFHLSFIMSRRGNSATNGLRIKYCVLGSRFQRPVTSTGKKHSFLSYKKYLTKAKRIIKCKEG